MKYSEKIFHAVVLSVAAGFYSALAFADEDYGSTWQIKCQQKGTGQEVVCWMVEVPNKPVEGIDIPFPERESK